MFVHPGGERVPGIVGAKAPESPCLRADLVEPFEARLVIFTNIVLVPNEAVHRVILHPIGSPTYGTFIRPEKATANHEQGLVKLLRPWMRDHPTLEAPGSHNLPDLIGLECVLMISPARTIGLL
jgi:hypothetical protein